MQALMNVSVGLFAVSIVWLAWVLRTTDAVAVLSTMVVIILALWNGLLMGQDSTPRGKARR